MDVRSLSIVAVGATALLIIGSGCGGGLGAAQSQGTAQTTHIGAASISYIGKPAVSISTDGQTISIAGMAGASITSFTLAPSPNTADAAIVFLSSPNTISILSGATAIGNAENSYAQVLTSAEPIPSAPTFTQDGRILYNRLDSVSGKIQIYACYYDGTGVTQMTKTALNHMNPATSPNNKLISFDDGAGHIYTLPLSVFGAETKLAITGNGSQAAWAPTSASIAYVAAVSGVGQINTVLLATPATLTAISKSVSTMCASPTWSPDGTKVSFDYVASDGTTDIASVDPTATTNVVKLLNGDGYDVQPSYTPDSKDLVFERGEADTTGGTTTGTTTGTTGGVGIPSAIVATIPDGDSADYLTQITSGLASSGANCSGFLSPVTYIGASGSVLSSASGFLWVENSGSFGSFVAFTATTPTKATETVAPNSNGLIYDLHADAITALKYSNGYYTPPIAVTTGTGITDVFVSYDPNTGKVASVAPFVAVRGGAKPAVTNRGGTITLVGSFTGVWNAKGVNQAPGGTSQITLDAKTGKLVS